MAALPEAGRFEQLWARQESADLFEICCIPFFVHKLALGDVVRTDTEGENAYVIKTFLGRPAAGPFVCDSVRAQRTDSASRRRCSGLAR